MRSCQSMSFLKKISETIIIKLYKRNSLSDISASAMSGTTHVLQVSSQTWLVRHNEVHFYCCVAGQKLTLDVLFKPVTLKTSKPHLQIKLVTCTFASECKW